MLRKVPRRSAFRASTPVSSPSGLSNPPGSRAEPGVRSASLCEGRLVVDLADLRGSARVLDRLHARGKAVHHLASERADLLTIFLNLTGRSLRDP